MLEKAGLWGSKAGARLEASVVDKVHGSRTAHEADSNRGSQKNG